MRVACANDVIVGEWIVFASAKTIDDACWNADGAQHHCHGRCEVLAVTLLAFEEKLGKRIRRGSIGELQGIAEIGAEIVLDGGSFVEVGALIGSDFTGEGANASVNRRQAQVVFFDIRGVVAGALA